MGGRWIQTARWVPGELSRSTTAPSGIGLCCCQVLCDTCHYLYFTSCIDSLFYCWLVVVMIVCWWTSAAAQLFTSCVSHREISSAHFQLAHNTCHCLHFTSRIDSPFRCLLVAVVMVMMELAMGGRATPSSRATPWKIGFCYCQWLHDSRNFLLILSQINSASCWWLCKH